MWLYGGGREWAVGGGVLATVLVDVTLPNDVLSTPTSDLQLGDCGLSRIMIAKAEGRASVHRLPVAVSMISHRRLRRACRPSVLPTLARRIPKLFAADHNVVNCNMSAKTTKNVDLHNVNTKIGTTKKPAADLLILVSKRPRCVNLVKRPVTSTCRDVVTRQIRILHNPTSILCKSGTVNKIVGVIAHGVRRSKIGAGTRVKCNSCGALRARISGHIEGKHFDDIIANSCGHASKRHSSVRFRRCNNCTGLKCSFDSA